jgi:NAD(P)-dependent dehydrogenase (short-subunit alcohol dehydrogenase family)
MSRLANHHVVVTGATGGLGVAVVERLIADGAICHLPCVESRLPEHVTWSTEKRAQSTLDLDVGNEATTDAYYGGLPPLWASVHLVGGFAMGPIALTSLADFDHMHALNARTCFLCCRAAVRSMRAAGTRAGGRIVNVAARPALEPVADMSAYAASKAAVASLTRSLAAELRDEAILVNAVVPSIIDTPTNRESMPDADFGAWPSPREIAETVAFLVSPANSLTSGALVPIYGRA